MLIAGLQFPGRAYRLQTTEPMRRKPHGGRTSLDKSDAWRERLSVLGLDCDDDELGTIEAEYQDLKRQAESLTMLIDGEAFPATVFVADPGVAGPSGR